MSGYWLKCPHCGSAHVGSKWRFVNAFGDRVYPNPPLPIRQQMMNECHMCGAEEDRKDEKEIVE